MKNREKIKAGIRHIAHHEPEVFSAKVLSIDTSAYTISVIATIDSNDDNAVPIEASLNAITGNGGSIILLPAINSDVVIGTVDGPGEYSMLKAANITKAIITIGSQVFTMDGSYYTMQTGSESMGKIMDDLMTAIINQTYQNGAGTTTPPLNVSDFSSIQSRLKQFLR